MFTMSTVQENHCWKSSNNLLVTPEHLLFRVVTMNNSAAERLLHGQTADAMPLLVEALRALRESMRNVETSSQNQSEVTPEQESLDHVQAQESGFDFQESHNHIAEEVHQQPLFEFVALPVNAVDLKGDTLPSVSRGTEANSYRAEVRKVSVEEHNGSSLSLPTNSDNILQEYYVHKHPLWIYEDRLNHRSQEHCQNAISFCLLFNLGLYHHMIAIMPQGGPKAVDHHHTLSRGVTPSLDVSVMTKAITCYELSYNVLEIGGFIIDEPHLVYTSLVLVNNMGHGHLALHNDLIAGRCIENLWSILASVRYGDMSTSWSSIGISYYSVPPPASSFLPRRMDGSQNALDGFWENVFHYYFVTQEGLLVAPAA